MDLITYDSSVSILNLRKRFPNRPILFLAGPTLRGNLTKQVSWREEAIEILRQSCDPRLVVISPEWSNADHVFKHGVSSWIPHWEMQAMTQADCVMFWVPRTQELIGLTTNFELGYWLAADPDKVCYGRPPQAWRTHYTDSRVLETEQTIHQSLRLLIEVAAERAMIRVASTERGNACPSKLSYTGKLLLELGATTLWTDEEMASKLQRDKISPEMFAPHFKDDELTEAIEQCLYELGDMFVDHVRALFLDHLLGRAFYLDRSVYGMPHGFVGRLLDDTLTESMRRMMQQRGITSNRIQQLLYGGGKPITQLEAQIIGQLVGIDLVSAIQRVENMHPATYTKEEWEQKSQAAIQAIKDAFAQPDQGLGNT